jgi:UDP-2,4-diacetamido-2,4,6-trideoxy-beta-L-altropyranose hydrolase
MSLGVLLVRADAGLEQGIGHVMRCLALAQAWQDRGGNAVFVLAQSTPEILDRIREEKFAIELIQARTGSAQDASAVLALARLHSARWIALDGYDFSYDYQQAVNSAAARRLVLDDSIGENLASRISADIILNQNLHATESLYREFPESELLLGPGYALLRREFRGIRKDPAQTSSLASRILITMGGTDPRGLTAVAIAAIRMLDLPDLHLKVVVGSRGSHVQEWISSLSPLTEIVYESRDMARSMSQADLIIASAGSTCWELCAVGLPAIVIDAAGNQTPLAEELQARGIACHVPLRFAGAARIAQEVRRLFASPQERAAMSAAAIKVADCDGASRVVAAMRVRDLVLRPVHLKDSRTLWKWANDPAVRQASFCSNPISWEEHCSWFADQLNHHSAWVFEDGSGAPVAAVRFRFIPPLDAIVSITLSPAERGARLGPHIITRAVAHLFATSPVVRVHAHIKKENVASIKAFENAGFNFAGDNIVRGCEAFRYVRERTSARQEQFTAAAAGISCR